MVGTGQVVAWGVLVTVAGGFAWLGASTYRRREGPGMASFAGYCVLLAVTLAGFVGFQYFDAIVEEVTGGQVPLAMLVATIVTFFSFQAAGLVAPILWVRYTLAFTGQRIPTTRRTTLLIAAPAIVAVGFLVVFLTLPPLYVALDRPLPAIPAQLISQYVLAVAVFYMASLLIAGAALIAWTSYTYRHLSTRGGAMLAVGCTLPWAALAVPIVARFFEDQPGLLSGHAALGALVGGLAVAAAVARHDFFASVPAAGTIGRSVTIEAMTTPVLVVDETRRVVDLNPAAAALFDVSETAIGDPLATVLDGAVDPDELVGGSGRVFTLAGGQHIIEASSSELTDEYGRVLGHSIVCHDITDRTRRDQRIQVLNRVLRHNLRNEMSVVDGYAELLEDAPAEFAAYAAEIRGTTTTLIDVGEKAREIESVLSPVEDPPTAPLEPVLDRAIEAVEAAYPETEIRVDPEIPSVPVEERVLAPIVRELVENGAEHNDAVAPRVSITADVAASDGGAGDETLAIRVRDNGPGIPDHELSPIRSGSETDLDHGSGLGLWLVAWGVTTVNGHAEFEATGDGTTAIVRVPLAG